MPNAADASAGTLFVCCPTGFAEMPMSDSVWAGAEPDGAWDAVEVPWTVSAPVWADPANADAADAGTPSVCPETPPAIAAACAPSDVDCTGTGAASAATPSSDATSDGTEPCPEAVCEADWLWTAGVPDVPNSDAADDGAGPSADAMPYAADASAGTSFAIFCTEEAIAPFGVDPATPKADAISDGTASCEDIAEPEVAAAADPEDAPSICWADGSADPAEA